MNKYKPAETGLNKYKHVDSGIVKNKLAEENNFAAAAEQDSLDDKEVEAILEQPARPPKQPPKSTSIVASPTSLKVSEPTETKRVSPFNRFRSSLVMGGLGSNRDSPKSKVATPTTPSNADSNPLTSAIRSSNTSAPSSGSHRQRTESETSSNKSTEKSRSRFFYRKSRTGPLPGDEKGETTPTSSVASTTSNSTTNLGSAIHLTLSQEEVSQTSLNTSNNQDRPCPDRFAIRAKSEFCPRTASAVSGSDYVNSSAISGSTSGAADSTSGENPTGTGSGKDNLLMAAAKRWASYDKPTYQTPFTRDNWKRSHRKFNYSRFLNYTRETFV